MKRFLFFLAVASTALACASNGASPDEIVDTSDEALTSCGPARYADALAHYKNAVAWSKDRLAHGVCRSENGFLWAIADEASRAVMTCGDFRRVIRTSPWAWPVREALAPSLTLRSLTGELLVIKDSPWQSWTGTERLFERGTTFWARAAGAYGSPVRIDFRDDGDATWGELVYDEATGDISWREVGAHYTIAMTGTAVKPRTVTVVHEGKSVSFTLGVDDPAEYQAAPIFVLEPIGAGAPKLYSLVSECDA